MDRRGKSATEGRRSVEAQRDEAAVAAARGGFAAWLRAGRAARQLTVEDVARVTRIQQRALERLESGQFEELPAEVFVRGFVRNYARCVGLDEDEALARYTECGLAPAPVSSPQAQALLDSMSSLAPDAARSSSPRVLRTRATGSMPAASPRTTGSFPVVAPRTTGSFPAIAVPPSPSIEEPILATSSASLPVAPAEPEIVIAPAAEIVAAPIAPEPIPAAPVEIVAAPVEIVAAPVEIAAAPVEIPGATGGRGGKGRRRKGGTDAAPARRGKRNRKGQPMAAAVATPAPVVAAAPAAAAPVVAEPVTAPVVAPIVAEVAAPAPVAAPVEIVVAPVVTSTHVDDDLEIEVIIGAEASASIALPVAALPIAAPPIAASQAATTTQPLEIVPTRAPARPRTSAQMSSPAIVLVIDDADPEQAERAREEREVKEPTRRSFLPPILMDDERSGRQGGLTLAVIILLIVATLTLSYLMRRPNSSGEGVTAREIPTRAIA
ncbi:MAG: helix-turn-helix domain-containing protein [Deltaproteobacteria bacterium]|nr:helix-turn-helix domain-containing protein [Deltaproteobacteria bacterium]